MGRIIEVERCRECPYMMPDDTLLGTNWCLHEGANAPDRISSRVETFPKSCPLLDQGDGKPTG